MNALDTSYLDAFIETVDNMIDDNTVRVEDGIPNEKVVHQLENLYQTVDLNKNDSLTIRKAIQMALIRSIKVDKIQSIHQITPDLIAYIIGYLAIPLYKQNEELTIFDPAVGSGNLLTSIIDQISDELGQKIKGIGIDNDDSLISVASISSSLQKLDVDLVHQDSIDEISLPPIDLVVSDLPVGFYPIDDNVEDFETKSVSGHSYVHHLMMERSIECLKEGGFAFFVVPSNLFQTSEAKGLLKWMQDSAYLQGILNLPSELFLNDEAQKAIMILQKHGPNAKQADKVMLGEFPSFKDVDKLQKFINDTVDWEEKDLL
ncbi:class I SAM-dependent methyltransferase [Fructilactobacillus vespulae]